MPDVARVVEQRAAPLDRVEVLGERLEVGPGHAFEQRVGRHVLDVLERPDEQLAVLGADRRDREAAVAGDDRGDAVPARGRERGVPEDLGVVVGVDVDEAGRDHVAARVEHPLPVEALPDVADDPVGDGDVGGPGRRCPSRRPASRLG